MRYFIIALLVIFNSTVQADDAIDFGELFKKGKQTEQTKLSDQELEDMATKDEILLSAADTYNAESDYVRALEFLHQMDLKYTARWCDVAAAAYLGDRQYVKAKEAFICAKKEYEAEGNAKKVHDMQAHINFLTPKK